MHCIVEMFSPTDRRDGHDAFGFSSAYRQAEGRDSAFLPEYFMKGIK